MSDTAPINLEEFARRVLALYGPLKRTPRWRRMLDHCGDTLIRLGIKLGGTVDICDDR